MGEIAMKIEGMFRQARSRESTRGQRNMADTEHSEEF